MGKSIAIDVRMIHSSGIGRYISSLLHLIINRSDLTITLLGSRDDLVKYGWLKSRNIRLIECSARIYTLHEQLELARNIPHICDLFWSPHYNIPLLPIRAKNRIVTIHDVFHLAFLRTLNLKQKIYAKTMLNAAARLSSRIITVSNFSKNELIKHTGINQNKISVIHNAVNTAIFKPLAKHHLYAVKQKHDLPDSFILFVGNLKPHKNLKRLLHAFLKLCKDTANKHQLVIAGTNQGLITEDKELFQMFKNNSILNKRVIFCGHVQDEDLPAFYSLASLFVFPSLYEGFGLTPLEAMACKCPTVVSNAASLPEACGDASYFVNPYSTEDIASSIQNVLTDKTLRNTLIEKGLERVNHFSWEESADKHLALFLELLNK